MIDAPPDDRARAAQALTGEAGNGRRAAALPDIEPPSRGALAKALIHAPPGVRCISPHL